MAPSSPSSKIIAREGITFDDVLLRPRYTDVKRGDVDLTTVLHPRLTLRVPIMSSPMDTVTESAMAIVMAQSGGMGIIHRNLTVQSQAAMVRTVKRAKASEGSAIDSSGRLLVGAAVGAGSDLPERLKALSEEEVDLVVVDSGHGHSKFILDAVTFAKRTYGKRMIVMGGNVATGEGAKALVKAGVDIIRVGVGPGSICTTRIVTGMGVPQITAFLDVAAALKGTKVTFVADGGIRQMGDMAKSLAAGASAVMLGSMLSGYDESPGERTEIDGKQFKQYRGMGSIGAMQKGGAERYGQSAKTEAKKLVAEGVEGLVPYKGAAGDFLYQAGGSLRSAFYYLGCKTLKEFHKNSQFLRITPASMRESHPHTIQVVSAGGSYMA